MNSQEVEFCWELALNFQLMDACCGRSIQLSVNLLDSG